MTVRYSLELEDVVAVLDGAPEPNGARDRSVGILVALAGIAAVYAIVRGALPQHLALAVTVVAGALLLLLPFRAAKGGERMARTLIRKHPHLFTGECEETLTVAGITSRVADITTFYSWPELSHFEENPTHFVLYDRDGTAALMIPRRALAEPAQCAALLATCLPASGRGTMHVIIDDAPSPY
ncbi:hypothetical protein GCM10027589_07710 [Actinocorallia lasiicapitis]